MTAVQFNHTLYNIPTCQLILGTTLQDKPTFMALAWATRVNFQPPLFAIGVNKNNASHDAVQESGEFSLAMPSSGMFKITDYVGLVSAKQTDKSELFDLFYGELHKAPMIRQCPLNLSFRLYQTVELPTNSIFIGELVESWCEESFLHDGKPDVQGIKPFTLSMPDNQFWGVGKKIGDAWSAGKSLKHN